LSGVHWLVVGRYGRVPHRAGEIAKRLIRPSKMRPQDGGGQYTPDEAFYAAITRAMFSGCAWSKPVNSVD
jgi:hypothetical protein